MDSLGMPSNLDLPPLGTAPDQASGVTLPALHDVTPRLHDIVPELWPSPESIMQQGVDPQLANDAMARLRIYDQQAATPTTGGPGDGSHGKSNQAQSDDVDVEDAVSPTTVLPAAAPSSKTRKPLPGSRPAQALPTDAGIDLNLDVNKDTKPPYKYVELAKMAFMSTPDAVLDLHGVFAFVVANFAYYRHLHDDTTWKVSMRASIRTCKAFEQVGTLTTRDWRAQTWRLKDEYRGGGRKAGQYQARVARPTV